jgi:hypothetical protein
MFVGANQRVEPAEAKRHLRALARQEALLGPSLPHERLVDPRAADLAGLHRSDERLECCRLHGDVAAADEQSVAPGADGLHGSDRNRHAGADRLHLQIVAQNDARKSEFVAQQRLYDRG